MNLLRQKIAHLEQEKQVRSAVMLERDEANATIRKLQKKVERLQKELSVCRELNYLSSKPNWLTPTNLRQVLRMCFLVTVCVSIKIYAKE